RSGSSTSSARSARSSSGRGASAGDRFAAGAALSVFRRPHKEANQMRLRLSIVLLAGTSVVAFGSTVGGAAISGNARVTNDATATSYLRYDGTSDATTSACSTGRRSQNEPTVAVDPHNTSVVVAGSNDYRAQIVNGDVWAGYYRSTDGGASWRDSLVPGYPDDSSAAGLASPTHGTCGAAGDPSQSFDAT